MACQMLDLIICPSGNGFNSYSKMEMYAHYHSIIMNLFTFVALWFYITLVSAFNSSSHLIMEKVRPFA